MHEIKDCEGSFFFFFLARAEASDNSVTNTGSCQESKEAFCKSVDDSTALYLLRDF